MTQQSYPNSCSKSLVTNHSSYRLRNLGNSVQKLKIFFVLVSSMMENGNGTVILMLLISVEMNKCIYQFVLYVGFEVY